MLRKTWMMTASAFGAGLVLATGPWAAAAGPKELPSTLLLAQQTPSQPQPQPKGVGETIGEKVEEAVQSVKRGARSASETIQEEYQKARASVHDMGVQARVYSRLHWDKDLNTTTIDLEVKNGTATLRGRVGSLQARTKAVELTRDTVGVERVDDHLTVEAPAPVTTPAPSTTAKDKD